MLQKLLEDFFDRAQSQREKSNKYSKMSNNLLRGKRWSILVVWNRLMLEKWSYKDLWIEKVKKKEKDTPGNFYKF